MYSCVWGSMTCRLLNISSSRRSTNATRLPHTLYSEPSVGSGVRSSDMSRVSSTLICGFSCRIFIISSRLMTHFFHTLVLRCELREGLESKRLLTSWPRTSKRWAGPLATVTRYCSISSCSCLSVPRRPRVDTISISFLCTISKVISLGSMVMSLSSFLVMACFLSSSSTLPSSLPSSSSSSSSSSVLSGFSLYFSTSSANMGMCFFRRWRMAFRALALVLDIFFLMSLLAMVSLRKSSSSTSMRMYMRGAAMPWYFWYLSRRRFSSSKSDWMDSQSLIFILFLMSSQHAPRSTKDLSLALFTTLLSSSESESLDPARNLEGPFPSSSLLESSVLEASLPLSESESLDPELLDSSSSLCCFLSSSSSSELEPAQNLFDAMLRG
mmetsp:Transcript_29081/g.78333  ORF Transcript_29081/g.78333 Transcript_29081/m.78333 type:complete len:383 (-) Transcript_29081:68-1216(-)